MAGENPQAFVTRVSGVTPMSGFTVRLQAEEKRAVPGGEQVAWVAFNRQLTGRRYASTVDGVTDDVDTGSCTYPNDLENVTPSFFAGMQTANGGDTAGLRAVSVQPQMAQVFVEEE